MRSLALAGFVLVALSGAAALAALHPPGLALKDRPSRATRPADLATLPNWDSAVKARGLGAPAQFSDCRVPLLVLGLVTEDYVPCAGWQERYRIGALVSYQRPVWFGPAQ